MRVLSRDLMDPSQVTVKGIEFNSPYQKRCIEKLLVVVALDRLLSIAEKEHLGKMVLEPGGLCHRFLLPLYLR